MSRTFDVVFTQGQDESADKIALPEGKFRLMQNARLTRDGRVEPRTNYVSLGRNSVHATSGRFYAFDLATYQDNLMALGTIDSGSFTPAYPRQLFTYIGAQGWAPQLNSQYDQLPDVADLKILHQAPYGNVMSNSDVAYTNGFICFCTTDQTSTQATIYVMDPATGVVVRSQNRTSVNSVRLCASGNLFIVVVRSTVGSLIANSIDTTNLAAGFGGLTTIVSAELTDNFSWDLSALGGTSDFLVSYSRTAATAMRLRRYNTSFAVVNTADVAAKNGDSAVIGDTTHGVSWAIRDGNDVELRTLSTALAVTVGPTDVLGPSAVTGSGAGNVINQPALAFANATQVYVQASNAGSLFIDDSVCTLRSLAAHAETSGVRAGNVRISSKLYTQERDATTASPIGAGTLIVGGNTGDQTQFYASCIQHAFDTSFCSGAWNYGVADKLNSASSGASLHGRSSIATNDTGTFWACVGVLDGSSVGTTSRGTLQIVQFKSGVTQRKQTAEMQGALYVAGGFTYYYDRGTIPAESGFLDTPVIKSINPGTAGSLTQLATYQYIAVYEWQDAQGRTHRSVPSNPAIANMTGVNDENFIQVSSPRSLRRSALFTDGNAVKIILYRNTPNDSVFYNVCETTAAGSATYADVVNLNDQVSDTVAQSRPVLYIYSQKPTPNVAAQPCRFIAAGRDRIIRGGLPDPYMVEFSQLAFPSEPIEGASPNNVAYQARLPEPCTGVATLGDAYLAFTASAVYQIPGAGPQRNGTGEFFYPQALYSDGGCIDWRSIVDCGKGMFFQLDTDKLFMLAPGGGASWVGQPIRDTLKLFPVIVGSCLCSGTQRVVFACTNTAGNNGVLLIYDLRRETWSVDNVGATRSVAEYLGRLAYVGTDGLVYLENAEGVFSGALPSVRLDTGSFKLFPANGNGELLTVVLSGTYIGDCTVEGFISYDDGKNWISMGQKAVTTANLFNRSPNSGAAVVTGDSVTVEFEPNIREITNRFALRFDITNGTDTGGMWAHMITLEVEAQEFAARQPARNRL